VLLLLLTLASGACATTEVKRRDWSTYTGPGAAEFRKEELTLPPLDDSGEPVNRAVDDVKHFAAEYVVAPIAAGWRFVVPKCAREGLTRAGRNLLYPVRLVSNVLQGEWSTAGLETKRFAINTTFGILGFREAAKDYDLPAPRAQDLGLAFRAHGWEQSNYTALPGATVRDSVGFVGDMFLDPLTYFSPAGPVMMLNNVSDHVDSYVHFTNTTYDPYRLERLARVLDRQLEPTERKFKQGTGGAIETLQVVFLGVRDPDFPDQADDNEVTIPLTGKELGYRAWIQEKPAPVVFVLPGTGGHFESGSSAALAEMVFRGGYSAVAISSTLSFDFIAAAGTANFPGYAPGDAHDVHLALTAVDKDLQQRYGGRVASKRAVLGISMGGLHTLFLAAAEDQERAEGLVPLHGYIALNPPVSLLGAARGMDAAFNVPLARIPDEAQREARIRALFRHVIDVAGGEDLQPGKPLPLSDFEARFLVGIVFRMTLLDVLDQARDLGRTGDFYLTPRTSSDRGASYVEMADTSFLEYVYAFLLPDQAKRRRGLTNDDAGALALEYACDLRSVSTLLRVNPHVHVMTNANDLMLGAGDLQFLRDALGDRLTVNEAGGHLGNLWRPDVQDAVLAKLKAIVPAE
jgi:ABC-type transporter lipoprotein component MlaA